MKRITRIASSLSQRKNSESNAAGEMKGLRIGPESLSMETKAGNRMSYKRPEALPVNF
ncbi:hypothetical protein [Alkalicoccus saliphilus]|uniref:hypothetical protein n=1 Tax=Alkalicoccus saliphilus TaxID=200989 RepID=UPI00135BC6B0|nr:hypothetical protein [Alkalicoccus saliphilus]